MTVVRTHPAICTVLQERRTRADPIVIRETCRVPQRYRCPHDPARRAAPRAIRTARRGDHRDGESGAMLRESAVGAVGGTPILLVAIGDVRVDVTMHAAPFRRDGGAGRHYERTSAREACLSGIRGRLRQRIDYWASVARSGTKLALSLTLSSRTHATATGRVGGFWPLRLPTPCGVSGQLPFALAAPRARVGRFLARRGPPAQPSTTGKRAATVLCRRTLPRR